MEYNYSRHNISDKERRLERLFEILPGAISWSIIIGMALLSFLLPMAASIIMLAFVLYWVLRLIYMNIFLIASYIRLATEKNTDWIERIKKLGHSAFLEDIYHLVIIPVIKETKEIIEPGVIGIANGQYPPKRVLVVIAVEDSASDEVKKDAFELQDKHKKTFLDIAVVVHPNSIAKEARVKGANTTYAAKYAAAYFKERNIPYENVIASCFDADTIPRVDYFSSLTYHFIITPQRTRVSYQPIPVYHNNIWDVSRFSRLIDIGTSFFQLTEATNPKKLVTFSSHSMSFKTLVDIGYWPVDMISDDSAIFWKAFIHYDGDYEAIPIYTTVSMDAVAGKNMIESFLNIYKQKRRWAWGVENFPIIMRAFLKSSAIPIYKRISSALRVLDSFVSWATWSFLLTFMTWLPGIFAGREFATTTAYYMAPRVQNLILSLASVGIIICMIISLLLLPAKKTRYPFLRRVMHAFEWFSLPVIILALSALPALDAQTRLMLGRYMEFWVPDKYRKK